MTGISIQSGDEKQESGIIKIKKTVSIWVCEDTSGARSDTINRYSFAEECLRGSFREEKKNYDLMTVVILRLGICGVESGDNAIRLLSKIFSMELNYEEKIDALLNEFQISVTREISEEVLNVCNLSAGVYNKGYDTGLSAGEQKKAQATAYRLWDKGMPVREIADMIEVGMDTLPKERASQQSVSIPFRKINANAFAGGLLAPLLGDCGTRAVRMVGAK